jgi:glycine/D-amino acid oxidase-like deaminating enzyme
MSARMNDVVVVGAGVFGLSVALQLARSGRRVRLVTADPPGMTGASAAPTRMARLAHGADELLTASAIEGVAAWKELETHCGATLFRPTGVVHLLSARADPDWQRASAATLARLGSRTRELDAAGLARLCPAIATDGLAGALLECDGGVLLARSATVALHQWARDLGVETVVAAARPTDDGLLVDGARVRAGTVVWAVGAALPALFPDLPGVESRRHDSQVLAYCDPRMRTMPALVEPGAPAYAVPGSEGELAFALDLDRAPDEEPAAGLAEVERRYLATRFPRAGLREISRETCGYASTVDDDFLIGPCPGSPGHWIVGGDSGHGFKHALVLGRLAARAIQGEAAPPLRFCPERLSAAAAGIR